MASRSKVLRGIGFDPGKVNCAYAVWEHNHIIETDVLEGIEDVITLPDFVQHLARLLDWHKPTVCGVERYQLRPGRGFVGNMELVNLMIGAIQGLCFDRDITIYLVLPSVHKVWAGEVCGAKKVKSKLSTHTCPIYRDLNTEHEADAANVIHYVVEKLLKR